MLANNMVQYDALNHSRVLNKPGPSGVDMGRFNSFQFLSDFPYKGVILGYFSVSGRDVGKANGGRSSGLFRSVSGRSGTSQSEGCYSAAGICQKKCAWVKAEASSFITFCIHSQSGQGRRICFIDSLHDFRKLLIKDMQSRLHMCMPKIRLRDASWRPQSDEWTCNSHLRMVKGIEGELRSSELLESGTVTGQQGHLICRTMLTMLQVVEVKAEWNVELVSRSNVQNSLVSASKDFRK